MKNASIVDATLRNAVDAGDIPAVIAMAADRDGVIYECAVSGRDSPVVRDSICWIASMTKPVTAVAAMQLVEQGRLSLDGPALEVCPELADIKVLTGFDAGGEPMLRAPKRPMTLRHLLTHTSGFGYDTWNAELFHYFAKTGYPTHQSGKLEGLRVPLVFDPGEAWAYGIGVDWAGQMVERVSGKRLDAYMRDHIFEPLGMRDTDYALRADQPARLAYTHARKSDGSFERFERQVPKDPEFIGGGGGLYSTASNYLIFLRMLLGEGKFGSERVLQPDTVAMMGRNHMGAVNVASMKSMKPAASADVELFPGMIKKWGLSFLINTADVKGGRKAGSLCWAGLGNTHFWLDPTQQVAGVFLTQVLPFGDPGVLRSLFAFENAIYAGVAA
jgi:methyl acetate hydrolase